MPELPDLTVYLEALGERVVGHRLERTKVVSPFVLRTFEPPISALEGRKVAAIRRLGKRIVLDFGGLFLVIHLMIAGRLLWKERGAKPPGKITLATFEFDSGLLVLTEAGSKKRASLHVVSGEEDLAAHDPGGLEPLGLDLANFAAALNRQNRTVKRALTDPVTFAGIGNAYSDEILHAARLAPLRLTSSLSHEEIRRLHAATTAVLESWCRQLLEEFAGRFPGSGEITAFRPDFAAHGKFGQPCPVCGKPIQRIRYADNETNYCAVCQNDGRILADRSLSRLLKGDFPRGFDEN